jgi:nucleotide-binding universal stress UspA family protein
MSKTILLAADAASDMSATAEMTREMCRDSGDSVIVLHVHEFAVGRWGRMQVDCHDGEGERVVGEIIDDMKAAGVSADGEIREAQADEHDARIIVLGAGGRTDLPHLPFGSVAHHVLHSARRPVLIVPRQPASGVAP